MIKKILFAADLSVFTSHSLIHVEAIAKQFEAKICVVHVVRPLGELAAAVVESHCSQTAKNEVLQVVRVEGLLENIRNDVIAALHTNIYVDVSQYVDEVMVEPGEPASVILYEAERSGADLIVVGSHGSEAIDGRLLGSVAYKILQLAKVPVFMIPMMNPANMLGLSQIPIPTRNR